MIQRFSKVILGFVAAGVLAAGAVAAPAPAPAPQAKQKAVKDQGEYDIIQLAQKETDPQKKLDVLKQWEQKYPDSDFKNDRTLAVLNAYSQIMGKVLTTQATPEIMDASVKAAGVILDGLDKFFSNDLKPDALDAAAWAKAKKDTEVQAHYVLGYIAYQRKADPDAEKEFKTVLMMSPKFSGLVSYWYGTVIIRQKDKARIPEALWHFARSVVVDGPTALDPQTKTAAEGYLKRQYDGYHGSTEGLDELKAKAMNDPLPPAGFTIKSIIEIEAEAEKDIAKFLSEHPDIKLWRQIRDALKADDGAAYFEKLKGAQLPPDTQTDFKMFKAKVVSQTSPKELVISVDNNQGSDAVIKFDGLLLKPIDPGTKFEFKGVVDAYTKDPYTLTFVVSEKEEVAGIGPEMWDTAKKAAPKKPAVKKAAPKK